MDEAARADEAAARIRPQLAAFTRVARETCELIEDWWAFSESRELSDLLRPLERLLPRLYAEALEIPSTEEADGEWLPRHDEALRALSSQLIESDLCERLTLAAETAWDQFTPDDDDAERLNRHLNVVAWDTPNVYLWLRAGLLFVDDESTDGTLRAVWAWGWDFDEYMGETVIKLLAATYEIRRGMLPFPPDWMRVGTPGHKYLTARDESDQTEEPDRP